MSIITHSFNTFTHSYDSASNCLRGQWPGPVAEGPLRTHYVDLLTTAMQHSNCSFWLLDLRGRNWHTPGFGRWFGEVFAPAVWASLHQPLYIAYVLGPEHRTLANAPGTQVLQRVSAVHQVHLLFFTCEPDASEWLRYQQAYGAAGKEWA